MLCVQAGLADVRAWATYCGPQWAGEASEIALALEHVEQAITYLLTGKDECVRKATKVSRALSPDNQSWIMIFLFGMNCVAANVTGQAATL